MNAKVRVLISATLLALTLGLGLTLARHKDHTTLAGNLRPPYEFSGPIVSLPSDLMGTWQVGTTRVEVDRKTHIDTAGGAARPGAWVQVRAAQEGDVLRAQAVRVLPPAAVPTIEDIHGIVNKIQGDTWVISGRRVRVPPTARILGDVSPLGAVATVRGHREGTTLVADVILLSSATEEANRVEFVGRLDAVRGDTWVVDGIDVRAPPTVTPPAVGSLVSVRGQMVDTRRVVAERLAVAKAPPTFLEGWLIEGGTNASTWRVLVPDETDAMGREVTVEVEADTPVDERAGLARPGARVQIIGRDQGARVRASFARVLAPPQVYLTGTLVYIPDDPYAFPWTVDKTRVRVRPDTILDRPIAAFRLGDHVAVSGIQQPDGTLLARMISRSKR